MKFLTAALIFSLLTACASVPVDLATAPHVPQDRVLNADALLPTEGYVPVIVSYDETRDIGTTDFTLYVDGAPLALMKNGEQIHFFIPPGRHVLSTMLGTKQNNVMTTAVPDYFQGNMPYRYRIIQGMDGATRLTPS